MNDEYNRGVDDAKEAIRQTKCGDEDGYYKPCFITAIARYCGPSRANLGPSTPTAGERVREAARKVACEIVHRHVPLTVRLPRGINGLEDAIANALVHFPPAEAAPVAVEDIDDMEFALNWNRLQGGDYRALHERWQPIFDLVRQLQTDARAIERLREQFELLDDPDGLYTETRAKIEAAARANAIRQCVEAVNAMLGGCTIQMDTGRLVADPGGPWVIKSDVVRVLESLTKGEKGTQESVCPHCNHLECECSDFDVSPDMGASG